DQPAARGAPATAPRASPRRPSPRGCLHDASPTTSRGHEGRPGSHGGSHGARTRTVGPGPRPGRGSVIDDFSFRGRSTRGRQTTTMGTPMHERARVPCPGLRGRGLLEGAVGFALASVQAVTPEMMPRRTPCASWDLEMLLLHLYDSLTALHEGAASGRVALERPPPGGDGDPVSSVRVSAVRLLRATGAPARVEVGDRGLGHDLIAAAGAVEVAVHGWVVAQASGERRPV